LHQAAHRSRHLQPKQFTTLAAVFLMRVQVCSLGLLASTSGVKPDTTTLGCAAWDGEDRKYSSLLQLNSQSKVESGPCLSRWHQDVIKTVLHHHYDHAGLVRIGGTGRHHSHFDHTGNRSQGRHHSQHKHNDNRSQGTQSLDLQDEWAAYQAELLHQISTKPFPARRFRILIASPVTLGMLETLAYNVQKLKQSQSKDEFHLALFYYKQELNKVPKLERRVRKILKPWLFLQKAGPGCKVHFWRSHLVPSLTDQFDYLWLMDGDLRMDYFSWDLYRHFLVRHEPVLSQPSIVGWTPATRSTDHKSLRMRSDPQNLNSRYHTHDKDLPFPLAWESFKVEMQAPLVSTKIWPVIFQRMKTVNGSSAWAIEGFWNALGVAAKAKGCSKTLPIVVNAAPLRHANCHDLVSNTRCLTKWVQGDCFNVSSAEAVLLSESLKEDTCEAGKGWEGSCVCPPSQGACRPPSLALMERRQFLAPDIRLHELGMHVVVMKD